MSIILSRSLLLERSSQGADLGAPALLWNSLVTIDSLTVSSEAEDYPGVNLATDSTIEVWRATTTAPVTIEIEVGGEQIDAVGIARHNFGSSHAVVSVDAKVSLPWVLRDGAWDDSGFWRTDDATLSEPEAWLPVTSPQVLPDNSPVLFRFLPTFTTSLRLRIEGGSVPPSAAVLYAGKLLVMPHGISAGHVPLDQAHETQVVNGRSEAGAYLGRIITGQSAQTTAQFSTLPIDWYYDEMEAFVDRGMAGPFFFAWLPWDRPEDVGFAWLNSDPRPSMGSLYFDITLDIGGITR